MHVNSPTKKEPQQQKIIWFNPPYSVHVKRNIGRLFLQLISTTHFPRHHNYCKLFNRNNIKICNSFMQICQMSSETTTPVY